MKTFHLLLGAALALALPAQATFATTPDKATAAPAVIYYQVAPGGPGAGAGQTAPAPVPTASAQPTPAASPTATAATPPAPPAAPEIKLPPNTCGPDLSNIAASANGTTTGAPPTQSDPNTTSGDGSTAATPPAPPKLQDKATLSCADDNIQVIVAARPYEKHFGDTITIEMQIGVADSVKIDFNPLLKQGKLYMTGPGPYRLVSQPFIESKKIDGGTVYHLILQVRQYVPGPYVTFSMQIPYATASAPNGTPLWEPLQTPDFVLMQDVNGLPGMAQPTTGNTGMTQPRSSWAVAPASILMALLLLLWPTIELVRYINRVRPREKAPRQVQAWLALNRVITSGKEIGFSANHYAQMSQIVRRYLEPSYPGISSAPASVIGSDAFKQDTKVKLAASALGKIERVLVEQKTLTAAEHKQLVSEVNKLIPRPLSV